MSTVAEIEAAIKTLPPAERERLADDLPSILPELNGDAKWQRIINDTRPRPALTALGDEIAQRRERGARTRIVYDALPFCIAVQFGKNGRQIIGQTLAFGGRQRLDGGFNFG